jgi:hypothetical protein
MTDIKPRFQAAVALQRQGELAQAEALYRELIALRPDLMVARQNLVALLRTQARWREAEEELGATLALDPGDAELQFNLAVSLLASGDYAAAWPLYEARRRVRVDRVAAPDLPFPEWQGEPVGSLLLWGEQGFGDQLMLARYVPLLVARGVRVTLVCKPDLARLFADLGVPIIPSEGQAAIPRHDAWVLLGSLPLRFGTTLETLPPGAYLPGGDAGQGTGVVVRGRPTNVNDAHRSLPAAEAQRLLDLPGAVSLDRQDTGARDFRDSAEIMRGLARVVTVDTAFAHLAGALGKPVWILLPASGTDWRWLRDRRDSPWYPSAELFRQPRPGDWTPVIAEIEARLSPP